MPAHTFNLSRFLPASKRANAGDYPEKFSVRAFRIVLNYIAYGITH